MVWPTRLMYSSSRCAENAPTETYCCNTAHLLGCVAIHVASVHLQQQQQQQQQKQQQQ
jgi:hypothetical protein